MPVLRFSFRPLRLAGVMAAVLGAVVVPAPSAQAAIFTVTNTNDSGAGSLRQAVLDANAAAGADTIDFDFGVTGTITLTSGQLTVTDDLTTDGPGATNLTISGNNASGVFGISGGKTVTLKDVTIADGLSSYGGGIFNDGALLLMHTAVSGNSTFSGSGWGGGIYNSPSGILTVTESAFSGNSTWGYGGAIVNANGVLTVANSTFSGNSSTNYGGAISSLVATTSVTNSTFSGNSAGTGGGIMNGQGDSLTVTNGTLAGNTAGTGGGIAAFGALTLQNTIVASNPSGGNCSGTITDGGGNLSWSDSSCPGINQDPLLDPAGLQNNGGPTETIALQPGSPATDTAVAANCPATDQRGVTRPQGIECDIGSFELESTPDPITVTTTDDELNSDGDCSLREAIGAANADTAVDACGAGDGPDNVALSTGTYTLSIAGAGEDANATGDLDVTADLTIAGAGAATTIVDGADLDRVVHIVAGTVEISGLTIRNGTVSGERGGGIRNHGTLTLTNSTVSGNSAQGGHSGGGIGNHGTLTLTNSTVIGNSAFQSGGGIDNIGPLTLNSSTVSGNSAGGQGAGIGNYSTLTLTNSTVSGNTGASQGGGIFHQNVGGLTLINSTVSGNSSPNSGGGIYNFGSVSAKNTIVANNSPNQCLAGTTSNGHNLSSDASCGFTASGDLQNTDPLLGPLADNGGPTQTHALLAGSPAIDAGSGDCPPPPTDQRGLSRPQGTACDIGAYESASADLALTKTDPPGRAPTGRNLTYTLTVVNSGPDDASDVTVLDQLPPSVTFTSATPSQGTCGESSGTVTCNLGTIASSGMATIEIVVKPTVPGTITNTASVGASTPDPNGGNNADSESTSVCRITSRKSSIPCP